MTLSRAKPITFRPRGVSDAIDGTNAAQGAMAALTNLVPAPSTASVFVPRPAAEKAVDFTADYSSTVQITAILPVGTLIYGMVNSVAHPGYDEPFCYDTVADAFIVISGITGLNIPATPSGTGGWTPPRMAMISTKIIVCHPGFPGGVGNYFGWIDVSVPGSPSWSAGNTTTHALPAVPVDVFNFNGRAWYAVNNTLEFSDSLNPLVVTNANQVLTLGDNTPVTALGGLPITSTTTGSVVQNLVAFKGTETIFFVTGDQATSNLSLNTLNVPTGTLAPNSICSTPLGLAFIAPDGLRLIDLNGHISDPVGAHGDGVCVPFQSAINPSRMCAAFNQNTLRISVQNGGSADQAWQEYWLDFSLKVWTGPHTCPHTLISNYTAYASGAHAGDGFIGALQGVAASLWSSTSLPRLNSTYVENGADLSWLAKTCLLPDNEVMFENFLNETSIGLVTPPTQGVTAICANEAGSILGTVYLTTPNSGGTYWGSFNWGASPWGSLSGWFQQYALNWSQPMVFKQMSMQFTGVSLAGFALGNLYMRYQILGYMLQR